MSKITFSVVVSLLTIVTKLILKCISSVTTIIDLVDDGVINSSVSSPMFVTKLTDILNALSSTLDSIYACQGDIEGINPDLLTNSKCV